MKKLLLITALLTASCGLQCAEPLPEAQQQVEQLSVQDLIDRAQRGEGEMPAIGINYERLMVLDLSYRGLTSLDGLFKNESKGFNGIKGIENVQKLNLIRNKLTTLPESIGRLTQLKWLNLERNRLTSLPPEIGDLKELQKLFLDSNQLSSLPDEIGRLTQLKWLNLRSNRLTSLPPEIGDLKELQRLFLNSNQLSSLPDEIGRLINLEMLNLRDNQLSSLPDEIGRLTKLRQLYLDDNYLKSGDQLDPTSKEIVDQLNAREVRVYDFTLDRQKDIKDLPAPPQKMIKGAKKK